MNHVKDETYQGHEICFYENGSTYFVDIREDDFDGDIIACYSEIDTLAEARDLAHNYIDDLIYQNTHFTEGISI